MKKSLKSFFKGFSLVELMISLITISLISAAFAPIITKKLSSMGITVGSFGGNGNNSGGTTPTGCTSDMTCQKGYYLDEDCVCQKCNVAHCLECPGTGNYCQSCKEGYINKDGLCMSEACEKTSGAPSPACCAAVGATFVPAATTGTTDLCVTSFNSGDDDFIVDGEKVDLEYAKLGIAVIASGATCLKSNNTCCWKGNSAKTSGNLNANDSYSSADRTVCQYNAARKICNNLAPGESYRGSWRLLMTDEAKNIAANTTDAVTLINDLQMCSPNNLTTKGINYYCTTGETCGGAYTGYFVVDKVAANRSGRCAPYRIWVDGGSYALSTTSSATLSATNKNFVNADSTTNKVYQSHPYSVRCVTNNIYGNKDKTTIESELTTTDSTEPKSQADCPENTFYINRLYTGGDKNLCMSQYNMGDGITKNTSIDNFEYSKLQIKLLEYGEKCTKSDNSCCWKGSATSNTNDNYNWRTTCQYAAAEKLCGTWKPKFEKEGKTYQYNMRLMTTAEATSLSEYLNSDTRYYHYFSSYLDSAGLQLCDSASTAGGNKCAINTKCVGAYTGYFTVDKVAATRYDRCAPFRVWLDGGSYALNMSSETFTVTNKNFVNADSTTNKVYQAHPYSVRCVGESYSIAKEESETCSKNEPCNQNECPDGTMFLDKKYVGTEKNVCITQYNMADSDANDTNKKPRIGNNEIADYDAIGTSTSASTTVTMLEAGAKCSDKTNYICCWRGTTTSGTLNMDYRNYSPDYRTLCQYRAAYNLCDSWNPAAAQGTTKQYKWKLISKEEADVLIKYLNSDTSFSSYFSRYLDSAGLQFCSSSNDGGMSVCPISTKCTGAYTGYFTVGKVAATRYDRCAPFRIWLDGGSYALNMSSGTFTITNKNFVNADSTTNKVYQAHPYSVRCITSGLR